MAYVRNRAPGEVENLEKSLVLDTWAGRRYYAVELVGQTPKKARVRVLTPGGVMLPGRRYVNCGETVLVPKHAVVDLPKDAHKEDLELALAQARAEQQVAK